MSVAELGILLKAKDEASGVIGAAGDKLGGLMKIAGIGAAAGGAALVGLGVGAVKMAGEFDGAMREVNTLIGLNEKGFQDFTAEVNNMSKSMGVDAVGSSKALYQAISAGVPKENAIEFLKVASKAAIGGVTDTETAVDGLTTVLNAFKIPAADVEKVADTLFTTVKQGKTTMGELSKSLFNVAPIAASAGVNFDEVAASIATLTKQGTPTSVATTQIRAAIQAIIKPTDEMAVAMGNVGYELAHSGKISGPMVDQLLEINTAMRGVDTTTAKGQKQMKDLNKQFAETAAALGPSILQAKGFNGTLGMLRDVADGNTNTLGKMFGSVEGLSAVLGTTGDNAEMFKGDMKAIEGAAGSSGAAFEEMNKSFGRQMQKLQEMLKGTMITIGMKLLPAITPLITWLSTNLPGAIEQAEKFLQPFLGVIGELAGVFTGAEGAGDRLGGALGQIGAMVAQALDTASRTVKEWAPKIAARLLELGREFLAWIGPMIPPMLTELGKLATRLFDWAKGEAPKLLMQLAAWGQQLMAWIGPMIPPLLAEAGKLAENLFAWLEDQVPKLMDQLLEWRRAAINWLSDAIPPLLTEAGKLVENLLNFIIDHGPGLVQTFLSEWLPAAIGWIVQAAIDIIPKLLELVLAIGTWLVTTGVPKLAEFAFKMGAAILGGILGGLGKLEDALNEVISSALRALKIDIGPFHLDANGFRIDMPDIRLPAGQPAGPPGSIYGYATGGIVPGPVGRPQMAVVHGGEAIIPPGRGMPRGGDTYVTVQVSGTVIAERDLGRVVREELLRVGRRTVTGGILA